MFKALILEGGAYAESFDLMSPASLVQLEKGWSDPISFRSVSLIGRDPYKEVVTTIPIQIVAASEAACWDVYNAFATFIQQIAAWKQRDPTRNGIRMSVQATAGSLVYTSLCVSSADGNPDTPIISPPINPLETAEGMYRMIGIKISFRRKGRFINTSAPLSASSSTALTNRSIVVDYGFNFATDSPLQTALTFTSATGTIPTGHLIQSNPYTASDEAFNAYFGSRLGTSSGNYTIMADPVASSNPYSATNIVRWIAANNVEDVRLGNSPTIPFFQEQIVLAVVRSEIVDSSAMIAFGVHDSSDTTKRIVTKKVQVVGSAAAPVQILNLGVLSLPADVGAAATTFGMVSLQNTSVALSRVWIDGFYMINTKVANLMYIQHSAGALSFLINPAYTTDLMPKLLLAATNTTPFDGRVYGPMHMSIKARKVHTLWLNPQGSKWRANTNTITVAHAAYPAGLTPLGV